MSAKEVKALFMKIILRCILLFSSLVVNGQDTNYNLQSKYIAGGYDVVAYFEKKLAKEINL